MPVACPRPSMAHSAISLAETVIPLPIIFD
jgi:hypothetical protein